MVDEPVQSDGYYGDDDINDEDLDLSFLDEKEDKPESGK